MPISAKIWIVIGRSALGLAVYMSLARAEITLDGSLGPSGPVPGAPNYAITSNLGRQSGSNLFHSFGRFNINTGESATFSGPSTVENILSRVTGGTASTIDGLLRTDFPGASPNLFLMNPSGVMFGPNSELDVQGSFHATTADYIKLADGVRFNALPSAEDAVLTTAPPEAFGFLDDSSASISFEASQLQVPDGETFSVVGGDIAVTEGSGVQVPGGQLNLVSGTAPGQVRLQDNGPGTGSLGQFGKIEIKDASTVDVSGEGGGGVFIRGGQFVMENSTLVADTHGSLNGKPISINVTDTMAVTDGLVRTSTTGSGRGGDVSVSAGHLELNEIAQIRAETSGPGHGGNLSVRAENIVLDGPINDDGSRDPLPEERAVLISKTLGEAPGSGDGGDIDVKASRLTLRGNAHIEVTTSGTGKGGNLDVDADQVRLHGDEDRPFSGAIPALLTTARGVTSDSGDGGSMHVNTERLEISDGAFITSRTSGFGKGGDIILDAGDVVIKGIDESGLAPGIFAQVVGFEPGSGDAGNITIRARNLHGINTLVIGSFGFAHERGNITIAAKNILLEAAEGQFFGPQVLTQGQISIQAGQLQIRGAGRIAAPTLFGRSGSVAIDATEVLLEGHSFITSQASAEAVAGSGGGTIHVHADRLVVRDGAQISAFTSGPGKGGSLMIDARDIHLEGIAETLDLFSGRSGVVPGGAQFDVRSRGERPGSGDGGDLMVKADRLTLTRGAQISAATFGPGKGGNILLDVNELIAENGAVLADARGAKVGSGPGGRLTIIADRLDLREGSEIAARTFGPGEGGRVVIKARELIANGAAVSTATRGRLQFTPTQPVRYGFFDDFFTGEIVAAVIDIGPFDDPSFERIVIPIEQVAAPLIVRTETQIITIKDPFLADDFGRRISIQPLDAPRAGNAGTIEITAGEVDLLNGGSISSNSSINGGNAGSILITADRLALFDGAKITASTLIPAEGGSIVINAGELVVRGGTVSSDTGGNQQFALEPVTYSFNNLDFPEFAEAVISLRGEPWLTIPFEQVVDPLIVRTDTQIVTVENPLSPDRHRISIRPLDAPRAGNAGDIRISARDIELQGRAEISSSAFENARDAGSIRIEAERLSANDGARITTSTVGSGRGGDIDIDTETIALFDGSRIAAESLGIRPDAGSAGTLTISARDSLRLFDDSEISVGTAQAEGGDIDIRAGRLVHLRDSRITTSVAGGLGSGGNILIDPTFVILDSSQIVANAFEGRGGNIRIVSDFFFASPDSLVDASSELGISGSVVIDSPETDLTGGITTLPESFFDATALLRERCGMRAVSGQSSLVIHGGSIPPEPDRYLSASYTGGPGSASVHLGIPDKAKRNPARVAEGLEGCGD